MSSTSFDPEKHRVWSTLYLFFFIRVLVLVFTWKYKMKLIPFFYISFFCCFLFFKDNCPVPSVTLESNTELVNTGSALAIGGVLQYRCKSGYSHTQGDLYRACKRSGSFTGDPPQCSGKFGLFNYVITILCGQI